MPEGKVILFKADRGYGFIEPVEGGDNVYVHKTEIEKTGLNELSAGQHISYDLHNENGKISAVNLRLLDKK